MVFITTLGIVARSLYTDITKKDKDKVKANGMTERK